MDDAAIKTRYLHERAKSIYTRISRFFFKGPPAVEIMLYRRIFAC